MSTEHFRFTSTDVSEAFYDNKKQELTVEFMTGRRYVYLGVSPNVWSKFKNAPSAGRYVHEVLHAFQFRQI